MYRTTRPRPTLRPLSYRNYYTTASCQAGSNKTESMEETRHQYTHAILKGLWSVQSQPGSSYERRSRSQSCSNTYSIPTGYRRVGPIGQPLQIRTILLDTRVY